MSDNTIPYTPIRRRKGEHIKNWRVEMGMTQKELGDTLGRSERTIRRYETDQVFMDKLFYEAVFNLHGKFIRGKNQ